MEHRPLEPGPANILDFLAQARRDHGSRLAVIDGRRRLTYDEVGWRVDRLANHLGTRGLAPGDRLAVLLPNSLEFLEAYFAAPKAGLVLVPLNTRLIADELAGILRDSGARVLMTHDSLLPLVREVARLDTPLEGLLIVGELEGTGSFSQPLEARMWVEPYETVMAGPDQGSGDLPPLPAPPEAVAQLYYTSGTTGRPKGVMLTHTNVSVHARAATQELSLSSREVWGHFAPLYHLADAWATFAVTAVGGCHVMLPRFDAGAALEHIQTHGITLTNLVPTMLNLMVKHPRAGEFDCSSLRLLLSGGAPIAPELVRQTMALFHCDYAQTYGLTETSPYLTLSLLPDHLRDLPEEERLAYRARTGRPFMTVELRVVDDQGRRVADDDRQVGEIQVQGPTVTPGYWQSFGDASLVPGKGTSIRFMADRSSFTPDGWLRTGDLATIDGRGSVNIVDRAKDMIITGGENVYSLEVEHALFEHPAVLEAAAFGLPDEHWGERVAAAVVLRPGEAGEATGVEELMGFARRRLAGFKVPRSIFLVDELPRTGSGKIVKRELRERFSTVTR